MTKLKCLENFKPSSSNIYNEDEMEQLNIAILQERGVSIDDIALLAYSTQSKYIDDLSIDECRESVIHVLRKREQFHAIMLAINLDVLAENDLLMPPLQGIVKDDLGLFGLDEAIAISIAGNYGTIGVTNFGHLDVTKPGKISLLQNSKNHVHCFLDDIVGALAAVASIRVAQNHAIFKATGIFPI